MEAELFIKPGIKNFKELNPGEQGFSRAQSSEIKMWNISTGFEDYF